MDRGVEFRLLGDVEVWAGGWTVDVGPARQRCVLAALLVEPGRTVSVDGLVDRVWGERPPQRAREALYSYVSRLRARWRSPATSATASASCMPCTRWET